MMSDINNIERSNQLILKGDVKKMTGSTEFIGYSEKI